jgi:hypothetical protein
MNIFWYAMKEEKNYIKMNNSLDIFMILSTPIYI